MGEHYWTLAISALVLCSLPLVAIIGLANGDKKMSRFAYFLSQVFLYTVLFIIIAAMESLEGTGNQRLALISLVGLFLALLVVACFGTLWAIYRVQHIGWSKWWTLIFVVPGVNCAYSLLLLVWPGAAVEES